MTSQPRPTSHKTVKSSATNDLIRVESSGRAWWEHTPTVAVQCFKILILPLKALDLATDLLIKLTFAAVFIAIAMWYLGLIPDALVSELMLTLGNRILGIVEGTGLL